MSSDTNTKEVIDKEEKKSKKKEEEVEVKVAEDVEELKEERFYEHDLFPTERWHRNPIHHDDPDSRLERLSDSYSDWKSCVTPVPKGMTFELFADKDRRFTQEPRFSELDLKFLQAKGYEILPTPESDDHMTEETFLFTPGAEQRIVNSSLEAAFPGLYLMHDMTEHDQYHLPPLGPSVDQARAWQERLPDSEQKARRNLLAAFMKQRAARQLPHARWHDSYVYWIYYKPDSESEIGPWEWQVKEERWVTEEQAEEIWRKKGLMPPKSTDQGFSSPEHDRPQV